MLTLNDGRIELWQWDTGRTLTVDADCSQVHFSNKVFGRSIDVDVVDGVAIVPDILLQTDKDLNVWAFVGTAENGYTKISKTFKVNRRNKPADYVFTPPDQTTLGELVERLGKIEESQDPDAIKNAVDEYLANNPIQTEEEDPTVPDWAKQPTKPKYTAQEVGAVATVNGTAPDENGNVKIEIPEASEPDMTGYATERYVQENYQPKGNYLTEVPEGYATEEFVKNKIAEAELDGEEVDLSGYAQKSELPTKVSQLQNDSGYLTAVPDGYAKTEDIPTRPEDIGAQPSGNYALKTDIPSVPVRSVNGKTGAVSLSASDVGARPDNWMPSAQEVGALPSTYTPPNQTAEQVGADPKGTATSAVSQHNTADDSHGDIRLELKVINDRLTAFFDSDNQTLDELSEIVAYITSNKSLIDSITTSKVSVADIVNNLTSNVTNKPLSAAQGVVLKGLIDAVINSLANYQPKGNYLTEETDPTVPAWAKQSTKPSYSKSEVGLGNVDNVKQYSASNPPPYPVTSVNGKTGAVSLTIPTVPTKVSAFSNDVGYLTKHQDISGKIDKNGLTLGIHTDGLIYVFVDGVPVGNGIEMGVSGDVFGYVDENNNIVVQGNLPDGSYTVKYEMSDGSTVDIGSLVLDSNVYYTVTNNLTNCTNSNTATEAVGGEPYSATIAANSGYDLPSVIVTMGGNPVAVSGCEIRIAEVTGDIVITAVATESKPEYNNLADPTSADWGTDCRLGSDGTIRTGAAGAVVTNYIGPLKEGNIVRIKGMDLTSHNSCGYNLKKVPNAVGASKLSALTLQDQIRDVTATKTGGQFTVGGYADIRDGYFRFSGLKNGTENDIIITIDEEIV